MKKALILLILIISMIFLLGCTEDQNNLFKDNGNEVCTIEDKPVVRLYSTTWCPHCGWVSDTYERVVTEYADAGKIVAMHWELDLGDDTLTPEFEGEFPANEAAIFNAASPKGSVPAFSFGCKYTRIGNSFEAEDDLVKEEAEFRRVLDLLVG